MCPLGKSEVRVFGTHDNSQKPLPEKLEVIKNLSRPKVAKDLKSFFGNFELLSPVHAKSTLSCIYFSVQWTKDSEKAFERCKKCLIDATTLAYPSANATLTFHVDSSDFS